MSRQVSRGSAGEYQADEQASKAFDCVDHNKLWKILKEMRIPDHLTCLDREVQRAAVHGVAKSWTRLSN